MNKRSIGWPRQFFALLLMIVLPVAASFAHAEGLPPKDEKQILRVVRSQLDAFAHGDAAKAFSYAAPNIRRQVGTAEQFMEMVRTQYEVVYRPASATFLRPSGQAGEAVLHVQLTDEDGDLWTAVYTLQKQKNKSWRITGCALSPNAVTMV
ncbi:DUF4864 domain-containing protein [Rhodoferax saidenbachensis]|uniref:DUF4864 domain-containing protein n=1 Tax=Rhodoferax saidenbachensis TaxID=1484693 RepID=UPI00137705BA|nr:DUF4864 domain-containing protein [Rhodoferax saidenbachensis]